MAEREATEARDELERERELKRDAWRTVEQLKRRLAAAGVQGSGQSQQKKAVARKRAKAAKQATSASAAPTPTTSKGWSLYSGPVFVKEGGQP